MNEKKFNKYFEFLEGQEEYLVLIVLVVFSVAVMIGAFAAYNSEMSTAAGQEASIIAQRVPQFSFFQRLDYLGSIFFPWVLMLSTMIIAREVWLYRKKLEE